MGRAKAASSPTKGTKRKATKDANKPKRPTSSYFYFLEECRRKAKEEGRSISKIAEFTKECSSAWRALEGDEKKKFDDKAAKDKLRFEREMKTYVPLPGEKVGKSKKEKDENKPKRAQSAYFLFLADYRAKMKAKGVENKDIIKNAGVEWGKLSAEAKKPYEKASEVEKKKYDVAMADYNKGLKPPTAKKSKPEVNGTDEDDEDDEEEDDDDEEEDEDDDEEEDDDEDDDE
ncbi:hypothetical protein SNE40_015588 [Patella caerulea]|uniref:HMG box domain-containing protein n=1 Tax=Patella caerulea TaxID=87958 RepID=A0AAN8JHN0_PATCE